MEAHFPPFEESESKRARERLIADFQAVVRDSEDLLKATAHDVSEAAQEARTRLSGALEKARRTCSEWQAQGVETAKRAARSTDQAIRSHPYESIAIGVAAGVLIGALWKSR